MTNFTVDLFLKSLIHCDEFVSKPDSKWDALSNILPGVNVHMCKKQFDELQKNKQQYNYEDPYKIAIQNATRSETTTTSQNRTTNKLRGIKAENGTDSVAKTTLNEADKDLEPVMKIHVCDEAKRLNRDFQCPRNLLMREMRYFTDCLLPSSSGSIEISVHCDVQIFEWLMSYVESTVPQNGTEKPKLEPTNVISVLISSEYLKMDSLVEECIEYCYKNMNAIIATPCNMNCISDNLVSRIVDKFSYNEADDIKDKKDKFKSKIFAKFVEKLFDASKNDGMASAASLYRCCACLKILTNSAKLKCLPSRVTIERDGSVRYQHAVDSKWNVSDYVIELKERLKTWHDVFWYIWGTVSYLTCDRCHESFPCAELGQCLYHPDALQFNSSGTMYGSYSCCNQKQLRFDPMQANTGCRMRDHVINTSDDSSSKTAQVRKVYETLLAHRDVVCRPQDTVAAKDLVSVAPEWHVFSADEQLSGVVDLPSVTKHMRLDKGGRDVSIKSDAAVKTASRTMEDSSSMSSSDSDDEDEGRTKHKAVNKRAKPERHTSSAIRDAPDFGITDAEKWDSTRSLRWNQDAQREEDLRRMREMVQYLTRMRPGADRGDKFRAKLYSGGIFSRIEAQWKQANAPAPANKGAQSLQRGKPRLAQIMKKPPTPVDDL